MKHPLYLLPCFCLLLQTAIAQPCNDTLKATALDRHPCVKTTLQLYARNIPGATYQWRGPDNFASTQQNPQRPYLLITHSGNYIVTAVAGNCIYTDTVYTMMKNAPSKATTYPEKEVCDGDSVVFYTFTSGVANQLYIIDAFKNVIESSSARVKMVNGGIYGGFEISTDGCVGDTGYYVATGLRPRPVKPTLSLYKPACEGDSLIFNIQSKDTGVVHYLLSPWRKEYTWKFPNITTIYNGLYKAVSVNDIGCVSDTAMMGIAVSKPQIPGVAIYGNADTGPFGKVTFTSYVSKAGNNPTYTWMKNGTPIPGATGYTYTALNGIDILPGDEINLHILGDMTPCPGTGISNTLTVSENLSVSNKEATGGISIYPNPNNGEFTIANIPNAEKGYSIRIINKTGQVVFSRQAASNVYKIDSKLPTGIYSISIQTLTQTIYHKLAVN